MDGEAKGQPTMIRIGATAQTGSEPAPSSGGMEAVLLRMEALLSRPIPAPVVNIPAPIVNVEAPNVHIPEIHIPTPVVNVHQADLKPEFKIPDYKYQPNVIVPDPKIIELSPKIDVHIDTKKLAQVAYVMGSGFFLLGLAALCHFW